MKGQGNLFNKTCEEDRIRDLLKNFFSTVERMWSFELVKDTFEVWCIEKEMEEEFQREDLQESENDF